MGGLPHPVLDKRHPVQGRGFLAMLTNLYKLVRGLSKKGDLAGGGGGGGGRTPPPPQKPLRFFVPPFTP